MTDKTQASTPYPTLHLLKARHARERAAIAREAALDVLDWLQRSGVRAGVFGSLATDRFGAHSDVDFVIFDCPEGRKYHLEAGVEDRMRGLPFDLVYWDELDARFQARIAQEVVDAPSLERHQPA